MIALVFVVDIVFCVHLWLTWFIIVYIQMFLEMKIRMLIWFRFVLFVIANNMNIQSLTN